MHNSLNKLKFINYSKSPRATAIILFLLSPLALLLPMTAHADDADALNFIAGISRQHDNNLFRSSSSERSDNITRAYAGVRVDKQYAQQRFKLDFTISSNQYQTFDQLDFTSEDYRAAWLWSLTPHLTGTLSADRKQVLNSFQDFQGTNLTNIRNISTNETQHFEADYSPHNVWHLLGGVTRFTQKNSNNSNNAFSGQEDFSLNTLDAGVKYNFRSGSSVTLMGHTGDGSFKDRPLNPTSLHDSGFDENEVEAKLDWLLSGKSRLYARVGYVSRDHDHFSQRDFSGAEGNLDYTWSPTGKLQLILSAASYLSSFQTNDTDYTRTNTLNISPVYALSDKVKLQATASISERSFLGVGVNNANSDREDWTKLASVGAEWTPLRSVSLGANLARSVRSSNSPGLDFTDTTAGVYANLFF
ncbi:MAG: XrtB/PEP-CTERM-associated polysaccharide biosynthesis outer membrane protein EpsL [Methylotenera sp.]|nr:XrtB/PEP-CTERM-associated polysaccharide biosynthesis outer membrane protein EpsL [Methylotenera sp.]